MAFLKNSSQDATDNTNSARQMWRGAAMGVGAYLLWGIFPLYWKALRSVPALEILCHRIVWSFLFLTLLMLRGGLAALWAQLRAKPRMSLIFLISGVLIGINWYLFIWAVAANSVLDVSLGYFLNPLVSVFLGVIFLREQLRRVQKRQQILCPSLLALYFPYSNGFRTMRLRSASIVGVIVFGIRGSSVYIPFSNPYISRSEFSL